MSHRRFHLEFEHVGDGDGLVAFRLILKAVLRRHGFRRIDVREAPADSAAGNVAAANGNPHQPPMGNPS